MLNDNKAIVFVWLLTNTILFCQNRNLNNYLTLTLFIYNTESLDIVIHYETVQGYNSFQINMSIIEGRYYSTYKK